MMSKLLDQRRLRKPRRRSFDFGLLQRFGKDSHGGVLVYTAFALPILLGISGLSLDASMWYASKRVSQAAADSGALAAALEVLRLEQADESYTVSESELEVIAIAAAGANGYDDGEGDGIEVNHAPESGRYVGTVGAAEVIVDQPAGVIPARILTGQDQIAVAGRPVALVA